MTSPVAIAAQENHPLGLILDRNPYLDTLQLHVARPLTPSQLRTLKASSNSVQIRTLDQNHHRQKYRRRILIQRPKPEALELLRDTLDSEYCVNRAEIALDLVVSDTERASALQSYMQLHLVQRWHGKRQMRTFEDTQYWASDLWTRRNIVVYSDKPSKVAAKPCCHIEVRVRKSDACKSAKLGTIDDLIAIDFRAFWGRELHLCHIDVEKLDRVIDREVKKKICERPSTFWTTSGEPVPTNGQSDKERARMIRRIFKELDVSNKSLSLGSLQNVPVQVFKDRFPGYAQKCLVKLDASKFLPT